MPRKFDNSTNRSGSKKSYYWKFPLKCIFLSNNSNKLGPTTPIHSDKYELNDRNSYMYIQLVSWKGSFSVHTHSFNEHTLSITHYTGIPFLGNTR